MKFLSFLSLILILSLSFVYGSKLENNSISETHSVPRLQTGFVYLSDVDNTIIQEIRYAGEHNFVGRPIDGYIKPLCILTEEAANALKKVQDKLRPMGGSLKVYDCYRPLRAVRDFISWSLDNSEPTMKNEFFPNISKLDIRKLGYVSDQSTHCQGSTVDLTIVPIPTPSQPALDKNYLKPCDSSDRYGDNSIDMGTGFDCFSPLSHTFSPFIVSNYVARKNRNILLTLMQEEGFENFSMEWWHYRLKNERFTQLFDFPIE